MRIKRGVTAHRKHKKIFEANKGYRMTKRRLIRVATEAHLHSGEYAFAGRKNKKRDIRQLWIMRISQALRLNGLTYSKFMKTLKDKKIELDRKIMAYLVSEKPDMFQALIEKVK